MWDWDAEVTRSGMFAVVSEAWKNADEATKARYKEQAEERKLAERETESEEATEEATKRTRASRTPKEGEDETPAAKRKRGAFRELTGSALFAQEHRQEAVEKSRKRGMVANIDLSGKEASKMLHEQWKALDVEAKIEYENRAHEENVRRLREME